LMTKQGSGSVINLSGGGATSPMERFSGYGVSKAGVVRLTETLAVEASSYGVRVNAIAPGMVDTGIHDGVIAAGDEAGLQSGIVNSMRASSGGVSPDEAADLAVWLASSDSEPLTGKLISAVHDPWREWTATDVQELADGALLTLRRLDKFTLDSLDNSGVG
jgi:NAD(P)-dependent dehydrogenase (short-subunit alcohol dehydrogenase family)